VLILFERDDSSTYLLGAVYEGPRQLEHQALNSN
jgi:hypothetical protein